MELYDLINRSINELTEQEIEYIKESMTLEELELKDDDFESQSNLIKENLLNTFDLRNGIKLKIKFYNFPIELWKVAAVLVLCVGGYKLFIKSDQPMYSVVEKTIVDTVFVFKNIVKMDTNISSKINSHLALNPQNIKPKIQNIQKEYSESKNEIKAISNFKTFELKDLKENYNHSSKYLNEDSLVDKIGFSQI
jgi:hypothetical protein